MERLALAGADCLGQFLDVVVGVSVSESETGCVKEIVPIDKGDGAFDGGSVGMVVQKNNPTEALRRVSRVRSINNIGHGDAKGKRNPAVLNHKRGRSPVFILDSVPVSLAPASLVDLPSATDSS